MIRLSLCGDLLRVPPGFEAFPAGLIEFPYSESPRGDGVRCVARTMRQTAARVGCRSSTAALYSFRMLKTWLVPPESVICGGDPMMNLDGRVLAVFRELQRTGSVSHAAQNLGLSQSAVSMSLARLRRRFNQTPNSTPTNAAATQVRNAAGVPTAGFGFIATANEGAVSSIQTVTSQQGTIVGRSTF